MTCFQIVEAKSYHCGQIVRRLRYDHRWAVILAGANAHRELSRCFDESSYRRAWLIDGKLAGLGGVRAPMMSSVGFVWLALSEDATRHPLEIVREGRRQMEDITRTYRELATVLLDGDEAARRFAVFLGFCAVEDESQARAYSRVGRRMILKHFDFCHDSRVPVGKSGHGLVVTYAKEQSPVPIKTFNPVRPFFPFMVYTAGRSRTAWLSSFLSYGDCYCECEAAIQFRSMEQIIDFFAMKGRGSAETAAAPAWRLIQYFVSGVRNVVVMRSVDDIVASFARIIPIDEEKLRKIVQYEIRCMEQISRQPNTLTVNFKDLDREEVCSAIFEHCLPYEFNRKWWLNLRHKNVQEKAASLFGYYQKHKQEVDDFKRYCKRQLIGLVRSGALRSEA